VVQIIGEIGEKLVELGQHVGQQAKKQAVAGTAQSAKTQIFGAGESKATGGQTGSGQEHFREIMGDLKQIPPEDLKKARKEDWQARIKGADQSRAQLRAEILRRKTEIDRQLQALRAKKQQVIPKYISGKPGEARTPQEKVDLWQKQQKEAEKKKKEEGLAAAVKQFQGSREMGKSTAG